MPAMTLTRPRQEPGRGPCAARRARCKRPCLPPAALRPSAPPPLTVHLVLLVLHLAQRDLHVHLAAAARCAQAGAHALALACRTQPHGGCSSQPAGPTAPGASCWHRAGQGCVRVPSAPGSAHPAGLPRCGAASPAPGAEPPAASSAPAAREAAGQGRRGSRLVCGRRVTVGPRLHADSVPWGGGDHWASAVCAVAPATCAHLDRAVGHHPGLDRLDDLHVQPLLGLLCSAGEPLHLRGACARGGGKA